MFDVISITKNCGWDIDKEINIIGNNLRIKLLNDNISRGYHEWVGEFGTYKVQTVKELNLLTHKFENVYVVQFFQQTPYPAVYLTLINRQIGIIGFGRRTEAYPNLKITDLAFINGDCGFAGACNKKP